MATKRNAWGAAWVAAALAAVATVAGASDHRGRDHEEDDLEECEHVEYDHDAREHAAGIRSAAPEDAELRALYRKECGACHVAYPPGYLSAASHRRVLAGLERHFGQNAELDPAVRERLEAWLVGNAADGRGERRSREVVGAAPGGGAPLRITEGAWFRREHREVSPGVLARPAIRTFANCGACHPGAERWDFDDDRVKIPAR
jgi:hypothetical protein